ncbi:hypothetical protein KO500_09145 [Cellulophaga baltica]|uniref:hypothetical protein n=1 Tax=Cellulophaga TaxID=104264 RepID=UPI001C06708D|nr:MULTISPECIES: hypothetical protein [Cellulophaga]MBU2996600.1 hypothetical protein [Cellulophaga baltica]MDO6767994.1 hypothetical protein [Cellulophaga sp. 1_MG-2023]
MNKLFFTALLVLLFSCDDGDLTIDTIEFNGFELESCDDDNIIDPTETNLLFKINDDDDEYEVLILTLDEDVLTNEAGEQSFEITDDTDTTLTYRIYDDSLDSDYFCDDLTPSTPLVTTEIVASAASITITTILSETESDTYEHFIEITSSTFETDEGERITDLSLDNFGTVYTEI